MHLNTAVTLSLPKGSDFGKLSLTKTLWDKLYLFLQSEIINAFTPEKKVFEVNLIYQRLVFLLFVFKIIPNNK